jgi:hypothetical protein
VIISCKRIGIHIFYKKTGIHEDQRPFPVATAWKNVNHTYSVVG